jgi:hypothetical protein
MSTILLFDATQHVARDEDCAMRRTVARRPQGSSDIERARVPAM